MSYDPAYDYSASSRTSLSSGCGHIKRDIEDKVVSFDTSACFPWLLTREHIYTFLLLSTLIISHVTSLIHCAMKMSLADFSSHSSWRSRSEKLFLYFPWLDTAHREWAKTWENHCKGDPIGVMHVIFNCFGKERKYARREHPKRDDNTIWWMLSSISCALLKQWYFQHHFTHSSRMPAHEYPQKDTLTVWALLFIALATHDTDMGCIMVENSWSRFPGLIQCQLQFEYVCENDVLNLTTERNDTPVKGIFAFIGRPRGCDCCQCHACQHKAMIKLVCVVILRPFEKEMTDICNSPYSLTEPLKLASHRGSNFWTSFSDVNTCVSHFHFQLAWAVDHRGKRDRPLIWCFFWGTC